MSFIIWFSLNFYSTSEYIKYKSMLPLRSLIAGQVKEDKVEETGKETETK